jgi:hypothetical protein
MKLPALPFPLPAVFALAIAASAAALAEEVPLPATLLATRGKMLLKEDFTPPLAPIVGKPVGFASGFTGWRFNPGPAPSHGGVWTVADGCFTGAESPEAHHPATASYGMDFRDAIIQCDVRLNDVPAEGRQYRTFSIKATDVKDYVCALFGSVSGINALAYDDATIDPKTHQRVKFPAVAVAAPTKLGEWHTAVLEIRGDELVASFEGKSVTVQSPLIAADKHSIMLVASTEASFRRLSVWEALPNADWEKNKAGMAKAGKP